MKNKFLVLNPNGKEFNLNDYLKLDIDSEFRLVIEKEALGIASNSRIKPEYIRIAEKLDFKWEPNSEIGFIQYGPKADLIMRLIKEYSRQLVNKIGFPIYEVRGSNFFNLKYPVVEAYASLFGERLFLNNQNKNDLVMSYDASYPQFNIASSKPVAEKKLPYAHFSIADCYRYEQSGECALLLRGKRFFMPDLHPYFRNVEEAFSWFPKLEDKIVESMNAANRKYWNIVKVSSEENYNRFKSEIAEISKRSNQPILIEIRRDGVDRYWIIDVDYSIVDYMNQVREIGCIQIDVGNAKRLGIEFIDSKGEKENPVIIHSAIPGGIERYAYSMIDNFPNHYPLWIQPVQARLIPVSDKFLDKCMEILSNFPNLRIDIDDQSEPVSKRVKRAKVDLVQNLFVVGEKEINEESVLINQLKNLEEDCKDFPFIPFSWPKLISEQI